MFARPSCYQCSYSGQPCTCPILYQTIPRGAEVIQHCDHEAPFEVSRSNHSPFSKRMNF
jgi:hypothetical protein